VLNESTAIFWSDTQIENWIKEGVVTFSSKTLMVEETGSITLATGTLKYTSSEASFLSAMLEPYSVIYDDGSNGYKGLIKVHPRQIGNLATRTTGPPKYYAQHDRNLYVMPLTSAAVVTAGGVLSVLYSKITEDITAITDEYQHLPIIYAIAKAKQKDMKFAEANALLQQFYQEVNFERQDKHAREVDSLDKFRVPARGGGTEASRG
jgi:hypothetical protein